MSTLAARLSLRDHYHPDNTSMSKDCEAEEEAAAEEEESLLKYDIERQENLLNPPLQVKKALDEVVALQFSGIISEEEEKRRSQFITCASFDSHNDHPNILLYDSDDDDNNNSSYLPLFELLHVASACCKRTYHFLTCSCLCKDKVKGMKGKKGLMKRWKKGADSDL